MKLSVYGMTDVGLVRNGNEDSILVAEDLNLCAVCDGMGGHEAGEVASKTAADSIHAWFSRGGDEGSYFQLDGSIPAPARRLASSVLFADQAIRQAAAAVPGRHGMGTTVVAALVVDRQLYVAHAGDSRAYLLRGRKLHQVTLDHSVVQDLLRAGVITEAQAVHVKKNAITRALGVTENLVVDVDGLALQPGDLVLLCSDGLHGLITDQDITGILQQGAGLADTCTALIDAANRAGGNDNVSAILLRADA